MLCRRNSTHTLQTSNFWCWSTGRNISRQSPQRKPSRTLHHKGSPGLKLEGTQGVTESCCTRRVPFLHKTGGPAALRMRVRASARAPRRPHAHQCAHAPMRACARPRAPTRHACACAAKLDGPQSFGYARSDPWEFPSRPRACHWTLGVHPANCASRVESGRPPSRAAQAALA